MDEREKALTELRIQWKELRYLTYQKAERLIKDAMKRDGLKVSSITARELTTSAYTLTAKQFKEIVKSVLS